jgi:hypothetical protein
MKYVKLFENFDKETLKKDYERIVMSKDIIPNLIKNKIKEAFDYNSPIIHQIKFDVIWEPITFDELYKLNSNKSNLENEQLANVCVAGRLQIIADKFFTKKYDSYSDEIAVINERVDWVLSKSTEVLKKELILPSNTHLDNTGSHGPNCFIRNKTRKTHPAFTGMPDDDSFPGRLPYDPSANKKFKITTWFCLDESYLDK